LGGQSDQSAVALAKAEACPSSHYHDLQMAKQETDTEHEARFLALAAEEKSILDAIGRVIKHLGNTRI
jgi:hypothetical protein